MNKSVDLAIIGAGTAGLSAYKEASKYTKRIVVIDKGPLGSTCARVGCMPSKVLLQAAKDFHSRRRFAKQGILGAESLSVDLNAVLAHVRSLRDYFTQGVVEFTQSLGECFIKGRASFQDTNTLKVNDDLITAKAIIIATGSHSVIPAAWKPLKEKLLTSENFFEQTRFEQDVGVIGAGSIGLEFSQALARLGVNVTVHSRGSFVGGLSDPCVNDAAIKALQAEFPLYLNETATLSKRGVKICLKACKETYVDQVIAAVGRAPNLKALNLNQLAIPCDERGVPQFDPTTLRIGNTNIFFAGDVNEFRPLLHEAADEGRIAAYNAVHDSQCFKRRIPMSIIFTEPNIGIVGNGYKSLQQNDLIIGEVDYSKQGRATIMGENQGLLRVYGKKEDGKLLGAEFIAPEGEHLAHLLAWAMAKNMTAFDVLQMPFYHPVIEEGMRTALRDLAKQVTHQSSAFELAMCDSEALHSLS